MFLTTQSYSTLLYINDLAIYLFFIGIFSLVLKQKSLIHSLLALELTILGLSLNFIYSGVLLTDGLGQIIVLILLVLAGSESAFGLSLLMLLFVAKKTVNLVVITDLKQ